MCSLREELRQTTDPHGADPGNAVLRQLHDIIDNVARLWPDLQSALPAALVPGRPQPAGGGGDDSLPHVKPASSVRAGANGPLSR